MSNDTIKPKYNLYFIKYKSPHPRILFSFYFPYLEYQDIILNISI